MIVRCGVCRSQFEVPGPGRYACPACGSANQVGGAATRPSGYPQSTYPGAGGPTEMPPQEPPPPPPPPPPEPPSPKVACPECQFEFIVGAIDVATCPNCGVEVEIGRGPTPVSSVPDAPAAVPVPGSPISDPLGDTGGGSMESYDVDSDPEHSSESDDSGSVA